MKTNIKFWATAAVVALFASCDPLDDFYGEENGHKYVDLGLPSGTCWATTNIGASSSTDEGNKYAWGEVSTKGRYSDDTYYFYDGDFYTKYNYTDNRKQLEDIDDVASYSWGGSWEMPTKEQISELINECYWVYTEYYKNIEKPGYVVYKAKNSKDKGRTGDPVASYDFDADAHIFLPMAGYRSLGTTLLEGKYCCYWSSTLYNEDYAYSLVATSSFNQVSGEAREYGMAVRAVCIPTVEEE